jgi:very-short-patch-repair endonuclease
MGDGPAIVRRARVSRSKLDLARRLRRRATEAETRAWEALRDRRCLGLKFRRQQVVCGYIVDFYCAELRLAIEIDGTIHDDPTQIFHDSLRALHLATEANVLVIGIQNAAVSQENLRSLVQAVLDARRLPLSLKGEGVGG